METETAHKVEIEFHFRDGVPCRYTFIPKVMFDGTIELSVDDSSMGSNVVIPLTHEQLRNLRRALVATEEDWAYHPANSEKKP